MKEEDFNKIILEKALSEHQKDLINMAKKGWELHYYKTEESKEKWFESCYTLYKDASFNYINFKMTLANRLKMLRFREESLAREDANLRKHNSRYQEITEQVQSYFYDLSPFDTLDNEKSLIYDISEEVFKLYAKKIKFKNKKKELKDKKSIAELCKLLEDEKKSLIKITFKIVDKNTGTSINLQAEKTLRIFKEEFIPYFMDKRVNISQNKDLDTNFKAYDQAYKKRLNHLIKGIFKILIKHGLVPFKKKETDNYHTGEVNGEFAELQNSTAIFIFDLLAKLKCIEDKKEGLPYNGNEKKDFIRSRLEDQSKELSLKNGMPNQEEDYYL